MAVKLPNDAQLADVAERLGMSLSEADIASFKGLMAGYVAAYSGVKSFEINLAEGLNWDLKKHNVDVLLIHHPERGFAVGRGEDLVAVASEHLFHQRPRVYVILRHKHLKHTRSPPSLDYTIGK